MEETISNLEPIKSLLVCPACRSELRLGRDEIACSGCEQVYPVEEGVPRFAGDEGGERPSADASGRSTGDYERRYVDVERARSYNLKYERKLLKRLSTKREYRILERLLGSQEHCKTMLEIPCGGGRITPRLVDATDLLIEADIGLGQVLYGKTKASNPIPQVWMTASAFRIPLRDCSVDATVCIRLSHHLVTREERESLLNELLRVSRRFVIMTFFDEKSVKNVYRKMRGKRGKLTMTRPQVAGIAAEHGARLAACPWLSVIGSGHRYALMVKSGS